MCRCHTLLCPKPFLCWRWQGEQVFISYGPQGNDSLLQFYSFVEASNPFDDYKVPNLAQRVRSILGASQGVMSASADLPVSQCPYYCNYPLMTCQCDQCPCHYLYPAMTCG